MERFENSAGRHLLLLEDADHFAIVAMLELSFDLGCREAGFRLISFYVARMEAHAPKLDAICNRLIDGNPKDPEAWVRCAIYRLGWPGTIPNQTKDHRDANRMYLMAIASAAEAGARDLASDFANERYLNITIRGSCGWGRRRLLQSP